MKCPKCGVEWEKYYSMICPNCDKCYHWIDFGSDYRCSCGKKHYWYGMRWLDVDENGKTVFPEQKEEIIIPYFVGQICENGDSS